MSNATFEKLEDGKIQLKTTASAERVDKAIAAVYRDAAKKYKFPGFRPGKAPRKMVENVVGEEYARALATDQVVNDTFAKLVDAEGYRIVGQPAFDEESLVVEGEDYSYVVTFEVRPKLELSDTDISITMVPREATEAEINGQIDSVRERFAQLTKAKSRKIKDDDYVLLSFKSTVDGEDYEGSAVENYAYHLGQSMMPPEFEEAIVGAKPGDSVVAEFTIESGDENAEFEGKTIHFDIELHEIQERTLPEVNDDLAIMSGFESEEEMRNEIKSTINSSKQNSYDNVVRQKLASALAEKLEGDAPDDLVEDRAQHLRQDFIQMLSKNNMSLEQYIAMTGAEPVEFENDIFVQARKAISEELALEALARKEDIEPTEEDIDKELEVIALQSGVDTDVAKARWKDAALMTTLRDDIARRNAIEWLAEHATIHIEEESDLI